MTLGACAEATYADDDGIEEAGVGATSDDTAAEADDGVETADDSQPGNTEPGNTDPGSADDGTSTVAPVDDQGDDVDAGDLFGGAPTIVVGPDPVPTSSGMPMEMEPDPEDNPPIVACEAATAIGDEPLIDDFEDGDEAILTQDARDASWYKYNSDNGSDAQLYEFAQVGDSPAGGSVALHTAGSGFEWAGVGLGLRWSDGTNNCAYNASVYEGITFWGRGSGTVRFTAAMPETVPLSDGGSCDELEMPCWNHPGADVTFTDGWQQYVLPFDDMLQSDGGLALDPTRIWTMQFEAGNQTFDFWIDGLAFYSASHPPPDGVVTEPDPVEPDPGTPDSGAPSDEDASVEPGPEIQQDAGSIDGGTP